MATWFSELEIDVPCDCGRTVTVQVRDVQNGRTVRCPAGHSIRVEEVGSGLRRAEQATQQFDQTLRDLQRKLG